MAYDHPDHRTYDLRGRQVHSFGVQPQHLGTGTGTSQGTRDYSNGRTQDAPAPAAQWDARWSVGDQGGASRFDNVAPAPGQVWHAGHLLARQNGGFGNVNTGVAPQNPRINSGNSLNGAPTFDSWRGQEQQFHNQMQQQQAPGQWTAVLRDQPYVAPDPGLVPAQDPYFDRFMGPSYDESMDEDWTPQ